MFGIPPNDLKMYGGLALLAIAILSGNDAFMAKLKSFIPDFSKLFSKDKTPDSTDVTEMTCLQVHESIAKLVDWFSSKGDKTGSEGAKALGKRVYDISPPTDKTNPVKDKDNE